MSDKTDSVKDKMLEARSLKARGMSIDGIAANLQVTLSEANDILRKSYLEAEIDPKISCAEMIDTYDNMLDDLTLMEILVRQEATVEEKDKSDPEGKKTKTKVDKEKLKDFLDIVKQKTEILDKKAETYRGFGVMRSLWINQAVAKAKKVNIPKWLKDKHIPILETLIKMGLNTKEDFPDTFDSGEKDRVIVEVANSLPPDIGEDIRKDVGAVIWGIRTPQDKEGNGISPDAKTALEYLKKQKGTGLAAFS